MKIRNAKDFWAGIMFAGTGAFFMLWSVSFYQMGSAVRMGPGYFPAVLGGLLLVLGVAIILEGLALKGDPKEGKLQLPFNIIDIVIALAIYVAIDYATKWVGISNDYSLLIATAIITVLTILFRPKAKALMLISAGCVAYGYLMKPLGLVLSTAALVYISAFGGHEFKWKEVTILFFILVFFSVLVFVKGLTLPFPLWPEFFG